MSKPPAIFSQTEAERKWITKQVACLCKMQFSNDEIQKIYPMQSERLAKIRKKVGMSGKKKAHTRDHKFFNGQANILVTPDCTVKPKQVAGAYLLRQSSYNY